MYWFVTALIVFLVTGLLTMQDMLEFSTIQPIFVSSAFILVFVSFCFVHQTVALHEEYECMNSFHPGIKSYSSSYFFALGQIAFEQVIFRFNALLLDAGWRLDTVLRPILSPLVAILHPYALCLSYFSNRAITGLLCASYITIHFAKLGLLHVLDGMSGPFCLLSAALALQYLIAYVMILCTFVYVFRDPFSRTHAARQLESIIDAVYDLRTINPSELLILETDKEQNICYCSPEPTVEVQEYKLAFFPIAIEPLIKRANYGVHPNAPAWMNGFRPHDSMPMPVETANLAQSSPCTMASQGKIAKRSTFSYSRRNCERVASHIASHLAIEPHPPLSCKIDQAPITPARLKPYSSPATHRLSDDLGSSYVHQQIKPSYGTAPKILPTSTSLASANGDEITCFAVSPISSQESLPELVHDSFTSNDSTDIQTSSDDGASPTHPVVAEYNTEKSGYAASYRLPSSFVPFRALAASVQAKTSPMYAPKLITNPALKPKDEKPAAILKRSMWKLKAKKKTKRHGQNTQASIEIPSSQSPSSSASSSTSAAVHNCVSADSTAPNLDPFESVSSLNPTAYDTASSSPTDTALFDGYKSSYSSTSSTEEFGLDSDIPVWSLVVSPTSSQISTWSPSTDCNAATTYTIMQSQHHPITSLPPCAPTQSPQQIESSPLPLPQAPAELFFAPACASAFSGPAAPVPMTPKELAAAMSQRASNKPTTPRTNRPAPVYTLMDAGRTVVPKGGMIPPKTQYQVKDGKGTSLRMSGPKGLRV